MSNRLILMLFEEKKGKKKKTYNSRDSLVVTHPTTNRPACGLSTAERTGSPVLHTLWSYVLVCHAELNKLSCLEPDSSKENRLDGSQISVSTRHSARCRRTDEDSMHNTFLSICKAHPCYRNEYAISSV